MRPRKVPKVINNLEVTKNFIISYRSYRSPDCILRLHVKNIPINTLSKYKAFVYDRIETNAGNAYNSATGKFTTPGDGMYVFHTTTPAYDKTSCTIEIVKNGEIKYIGFADAGNHKDRAMSSTMTILSLKKGMSYTSEQVHIIEGFIWKATNTSGGVFLDLK